MIVSKVTVTALEKIQDRVYLIKCHSPYLASTFKPGQFANIKVSEGGFPLLRRPFSICDIDGDEIVFMFAVHGVGTEILSQKRPGDQLDMIAPLGQGFNVSGDFDTAIIIAGGIGAAPFPLLAKSLSGKRKVTYIGGRTSKDIITYGLEDVQISTDDGSLGYKGNVVDLFRSELPAYNEKRIKVFACGPNPMLRALQQLLNKSGIAGEISTESAMACGFGICQGCPIEKSVEDGRYLLICKDGPVFNSRDVVV
ncbi:MAG: dihydroorotate oxidase [Ignavibacteriaceae bacterium]|nr:MAG: dihydroorotate oxidase [Ignavibacteriaceae bacterium]